MAVVDIKGVGKAQFPDEMPIDDIRAFLKNKYSQRAITGESDLLQPVENIAAKYEPTLTEKMGQGISDALYDTGIISDRYGAQRIGENVTVLGEFLPGIGDATAGDEFGRAAAKGDRSGMLLSGIGAIPIAGDLAKKLAKAKLQGFDVDNIYRHDPGYRYPNPDNSPILEIKEGSDNTAFDGLFSNSDYLDADDIRNNDFIVKNKASHNDFDDAFYDKIDETKGIINDEIYGYNDLTPDQQEFIDDVITEDVDNLYDFVDEDTNELPDWLTELFSEDDTGAIEWELQRVRGQVAKRKGFDAVDMKDETGISTLLLSTSGTKNINDKFG